MSETTQAPPLDIAEQALATGQGSPFDTPGLETGLRAEHQTEDPRQQLIEEVLEPYHIHYAEGVEGEAVNPEASQRNFDTLLVLTRLIRDRHTTRKIAPENGKGPWGWAEEPDYDWYFEKYAADGVNRQEFDSPVKVVRLWLEKFGPHNDIAHAEADVRLARQWLIHENNVKLSNHSTEPEISREFGVIAELDIELSEIIGHEQAPGGPEPQHGSETRRQYIEEALVYLDKYGRQRERKGDHEAVAIAKMKATALRIELRREHILGTNQLTHTYSGRQYDELEEAVETEVDQLTRFFEGELDFVRAAANHLKNSAHLPEKERQKLADSYASTVGSLFEVYSYLRVMDTIIVDGGLAVQKFRPGTLREESSTSHKVDEHPNSRRLKQPDGTVVELPAHGFNYNFDFVLETLTDKVQRGRGIYQTVYFQNKINPEHAPADKAELASAKLYGNKKFIFAKPDELIDDFQPGADRIATLDTIVDKMYAWSQTEHEPARV
jgi:hypothetical protein